MSRATTLLLILALGLGLFVYFNADARVQASAAWQDTRSTLIDLYANASVSIKELLNNDGSKSMEEQNVGNATLGN
jgi:hypothetical protein